MLDNTAFAEALVHELLRAPEQQARWDIEAVESDGASAMADVDRRERRVTLNLHPGQMAAWQSTRRFTFMLAGTQGGKTSMLPWLLARHILASDSGGDWLAVTATYDLFKNKFLPELREVLEFTLGIGRLVGQGVIELRDPESGEFLAHHSSDPMWGRVLLRSASSRGGLESATARAAILDECGQDDFGLTAWEAVLRRLNVHRGPIWAGTSLYNQGWLKQLINDPWERGERPDIEISRFPSNMNPAFGDEAYEEARVTMQTHRFRMMYEGKYGRPAGAIFTDFIQRLKHDGGHLARRFDLPLQWARYQSVDPGVLNTAKLWAAHDSESDIFYIYRAQLDDARRPATEHARDDLLLEGREGERVILRAIGAKSEKYWREDYRREGATGIREPDVDRVEEGIDRVTQLLRQHRIFIFDDLVDLVDQILDYSREVDEFGNPLEAIRDKSEYHLVDALRYLCIQLARPAARVRLKVSSVPYA